MARLLTNKITTELNATDLLIKYFDAISKPERIRLFILLNKTFCNKCGEIKKYCSCKKS